MLFPWLIVLFVGMPILELALLLKVGDVIGWQRTIILVVATGVMGAALARNQGLTVMRHIQADMQAGRLPAARLLDGAMIFVAGVLLITPGLVTDAIGFLFLVPPARRFIQEHARKWIEARLRDGSASVTFRRM